MFYITTAKWLRFWFGKVDAPYHVIQYFNDLVASSYIKRHFPISVKWSIYFNCKTTKKFVVGQRKNKNRTMFTYLRVKPRMSHLSFDHCLYSHCQATGVHICRFILMNGQALQYCNFLWSIVPGIWKTYVTVRRLDNHIFLYQDIPTMPMSCNLQM